MFILFLVYGCTFSKIPTKVFSNPNWKEPYTDSKYNRVNIFATSNLIGETQPKIETYTNQEVGFQKKFKVGGPEILSSYIMIAKNRYQDNMILVNSGPFAYPYKDKEYIRQLGEFYKHVQYDAISLTLKDFFVLFDSSYKHRRTKNIPYLNSNLIQLKSNPSYAEYLPWKTKTVDGVEVGIISVTTNNSAEVLPNLYEGFLVEDPVYSILKTKKLLKKKGSEIIILLTNFKNNCSVSDNKEVKPFYFASKYKIQCPENDRFQTFLNRLPPDIATLIINHDEKLLRAFYKNIPVIQVPENNTYIAEAEIFINKKNKKINLDLSSIKAPIKLCHSFFSETQDCYVETLTKRRDDSILHSSFATNKATFLGEEITADETVLEIFKGK